MLLAVFFGLCSLFALVVTALEAWQEHHQARWPEVTAHVAECGLKRPSSGRRNTFYIRCRLTYAVDREEYTANLYSRNVPPPDVWQYPPNQIAPFEAWVNRHPRGTPMVVRYNPADHAKIVSVEANMPGNGPKTASNVKVLGFFAGGFLVLFTIARITRPKSL